MWSFKWYKNTKYNNNNKIYNIQDFWTAFPQSPNEAPGTWLNSRAIIIIIKHPNKGCFCSLTCCRTMKNVEEKQPNSLIMHSFHVKTKYVSTLSDIISSVEQQTEWGLQKWTAGISILSLVITNPRALTQDVRSRAAFPSVRQPTISRH